MTGTDYLSDLNGQQRAAVEYLDGPQLVIAGAGSGKTRVLTYKIVHLLAHGYEPARILALTFTNKAAREMRERIEALTGAATARRLWMGTFHSIFSRILRRNARLLGFSSDYTIYDQSDSRSLIKSIIRDLELDEKQYKPSTVQNAISMAKNQLYSPTDYAADRELMESDRNSRRPRLCEIYRIYMQRCRVADAMDFDDLLYYTSVLLRDHPEVLSHYREYFRYVLVDEFQDTNFAQNMIVAQLSRGIGKLCVVGDDAQSIYSFRGANIRNILEMRRIWPDIQTFKLEQNYRSTQNIINAANSLIAKNTQQIPKTVFSRSDVGERIEVQSAFSDFDEAGLVATRIVTRRAESGDPYSDFAILYRTNSQSRQLEEALRRRAIPYRIYGGLAFYQRKEVKDALAYFRLAVNPNDDEALSRIINFPARGIGETTLKKITAAAIAASVSMWEVLTEPDRHSLAVNAGTRRKLDAFVGMMRGFIDRAHTGAPAAKLAGEIVRSTGIMALYISDNAPETVSKRENIEELLRSVAEYAELRRDEGLTDNYTMPEFLTEATLATDQDTDDGQGAAPKVTLMTIHAAKGLEFANVFIVGVEEDLLPSSMCGTADEVEEERRLFYVAITRAKRFCMLSYAQSRYRNGQPTAPRPSRFLHDIDGRYLNYTYGARPVPEPISRPSLAWRTVSDRPTTAPRSASSQWRPTTPTPASAAPTAPDGASIHRASELTVGMAILHGKFGRGTIRAIDIQDIGETATVEFANTGTRKLLLKFAKFSILD